MATHTDRWLSEREAEIKKKKETNATCKQSKGPVHSFAYCSETKNTCPRQEGTKEKRLGDENNSHKQVREEGSHPATDTTRYTLK